MDSSQCQISSLTDWCARLASTSKTETYAPTTNQILFFTLVWAGKSEVLVNQNGRLLLQLPEERVVERARLVCGFLAGDSAEAVSYLKSGDVKEWELLRIQLHAAAAKYPSIYYEDVLHDCLLKIWSLLEKMPASPVLEATHDIVEFVSENRRKLSNLYDFGAPFYAFSKRVVINACLDRIRKEQRAPIYPLPVEEMTALPMQGKDVEQLVIDEEARTEVLLQLRSDLARLLVAIEQSLTPKQHQVIAQTLANRELFREAIELSELPLPDWFPAWGNDNTDVDVGRALNNMSESSVRVHRNGAVNRLKLSEPMLEVLLRALIKVRHT